MSEEAKLERLGSVTANYFFWQGLRWVPVGLILVLAGLLWSDWWPFTGWVEDTLLIGVLLVALGLSAGIGRYYRQAFGHVSLRPRQHARRNVVKWLVFYPAMTISLLVDGLTRIPFFLSGLVWGTAIIAYWWSTGRGRHHYVVAGALVGGLTFLPAAGVVDVGSDILSLFFVVLGVIYMVGGVLDHLELRRLLPPAPSDSAGGTGL